MRILKPAKRPCTPRKDEVLVALKACEQYMTDCGYFINNKKLALQVRKAIAAAEGR